MKQPPWSARLASRARKGQVPNMSTVQEIEAAITQLEPKKIHAVADWLQEYREELWDKQIEADAKAGKFDSLIKKAKAGYRAGKARLFREIVRAAGVLAVLRATAAQGSENRAQELPALAKATRPEIPRLQANQA